MLIDARDYYRAFYRTARWIEEPAIGRQPSPRDATPSPAAAPAAKAESRPQVFNQLCVACHSLGGRGGMVGPALDGVGDRRDAAYLGKWLHDPPSLKPGTAMPKLPLSDAQIDELVTFLSHQKAQVSP